jgi:RNA polymerase sigma-70 factor, ECF subfamily
MRCSNILRTIEDQAWYSFEPPMTSDGSEVTQLLKAMTSGDQSAAERLLPLVYAELHRLATSYMRRERQDHTLQPTALINEAYLRLAKGDLDWQNREHFIGVAANVMRRVLVDYARAHRAEMRGGELKRVELEEGLAISEERTDEMLALDEALNRLSATNQRQAKVVELRYFGGLSVEQIAGVLAVAPRSVKRDWALARIWLFNELHTDLK